MRWQCSVLPIPCFRHYSFCFEAAIGVLQMRMLLTLVACHFATTFYRLLLCIQS
jgi:hypothetical protein